MFGKFISLPFLFLRTSTAATSVISGLLQTFVFAHVLSPQQFSLFILVGALGFTLLLCDLGAAKILFVRLRDRHLGGGTETAIAGQATAILILYALLAIAGSAVCFVVMERSGTATALEALEFSLFFLFTALNLVWFAMRNISIAVDAFVYFEVLDSIRRIFNIVTMGAMLAGLPVIAFVLANNVMWVIVLVLSTARLVRCGALATERSGLVGKLLAFLCENGQSLTRSATFAASELFVYNFPFFLVPAVYGLGAPLIILDTAFKVFRTGSVAYSAACDLLVSRQTSAFAERDASTLIRATLLAAALCAVPASLASAIIIIVGEPLFAFLLGPAAIMPTTITPLLVILLFTNLVQMVALSLLVHTGFFKEISRVGPLMVLAMVLTSAITVAMKLEFVGFLGIYTAVYAGGATIFALLSIRGPIRGAQKT